MGSPVLGAGVGRKGVPVPVVNPDRLQPCPDHLLDFTIVLMGPRHMDPGGNIALHFFLALISQTSSVVGLLL